MNNEFGTPEIVTCFECKKETKKPVFIPEKGYVCGECSVQIYKYVPIKIRTKPFCLTPQEFAEGIFEYYLEKVKEMPEKPE